MNTLQNYILQKKVKAGDTVEFKYNEKKNHKIKVVRLEECMETSCKDSRPFPCLEKYMVEEDAGGWCIYRIRKIVVEENLE